MQNSYMFFFASRLLELYHVIREDDKNKFSEINQATIWLVGLASTILVLSIGKLETVQDILKGLFQWVILALTITVVLGIAFRILGLLVMAESLYRFQYLQAYMSALISKKPNFPEEPSQNWSLNQTLENLNTYFNMDFREMDWQDTDFPLLIYDIMYKSWQTDEENAIAQFKQTLMNLGLTEKEADSFFNGSDKNSLRIKSKIWRFVSRFNLLLFFFSAISFGSAICMIAYQVARH